MSRANPGVQTETELKRAIGLPLLVLYDPRITIVATLNGVVVETIMASRAVYGLGRKGRLPDWISRVNASTQTPLNAIVAITIVMLAAGLFVPHDDLVSWTSQIILFVFT